MHTVVWGEVSCKKGRFGAPSGGSEGSSRFGGRTCTEGTVTVSCGLQFCQRDDKQDAACRSEGHNCGAVGGLWGRWGHPGKVITATLQSMWLIASRQTSGWGWCGHGSRPSPGSGQCCFGCCAVFGAVCLEGWAGDPHSNQSFRK